MLAAAGWPKTWKGPTTPTKPQKVKNVVLISCSQATACARETAGSASGAKVIGWHTTVVDGKGDPNVMSAAIRNAVVNGASGIILESTGVSALVSALKFAKAHHVPVVNNGAITAKQAGVDPSLVAGEQPGPERQARHDQRGLDDLEQQRHRRRGHVPDHRRGPPDPRRRNSRATEAVQRAARSSSRTSWASTSRRRRR